MHASDTVWVLVSAALVLFMIPGLGLFYAGMVRSKGVLSIIVQSLLVMAVVTVCWAILAFSLVYGHDAGGGLIGNLSFAGLAHLNATLPGFGRHLMVPPEAVMIFQLMFAAITAALVTGAIVDRIRIVALCR